MLLIAASLAHEIVRLWIVRFTWRPLAKSRWPSPILGCAIVLENVLWIDALFFSGTILALGLAVAQWSPSLWCGGIQINSIVQEQFDHLYPTINGPEHAQITGSIDIVWVSSSTQQCLGAFEAPPVGSNHEGCVSLWAAVRPSKDKVDIGALFNLCIHFSDIILHYSIVQFLCGSVRLDNILPNCFRVIVWVVGSLATIPLLLIRLLNLLLPLFHNLLHGGNVIYIYTSTMSIYM
mmetsp:Transcript_11799/g.23673  ORF Transcript_11799/g.23673 Transcript_11799/m.23673 type:complete len:235 (-) Transcript_11799:2-706(-)